MLPTATTNAPSSNINVLDKHKPSSTSSVSDDNSSGITNLLKEEEQYQCKDFLRLHHQDDGSTSSSVVDAICRRSVCRWIFDTIDCLKMSHETAFLAITNLDRYMSVSLKARCDRRQYQLASMTSLYIAIKISDKVEVDLTILSKLSRGFYSAKDIKRCEEDMKDSLKVFTVPSPTQFIRLILDLLPLSVLSNARVMNKISTASFHQAKLLIQDYKYVPLRRSSLAVASIVNAFKNISQSDFSIDQRVQFLKSVSDAFGMSNSSFLLLGPKKKKFSKRKGGCYDSINNRGTATTATAAQENQLPQIPLCSEDEKSM